MTRIIKKELLPVWGLRDPNAIQPEEIEAWVRGVASGEGRRKPAPYLATRSFDSMAMVYSWAIRRRFMEYTPFVGLKKPFDEKKRTRTFGNDELRRLFEALERAPKQIAGLWLMLFYTGNRLRETLGWSPPRHAACPADEHCRNGRAAPRRRHDPQPRHQGRPRVAPALRHAPTTSRRNATPS
jgi:integrase